jgi:hypothetical protein
VWQEVKTDTTSAATTPAIDRPDRPSRPAFSGAMGEGRFGTKLICLTSTAIYKKLLKNLLSSGHLSINSAAIKDWLE